MKKFLKLFCLTLCAVFLCACGGSPGGGGGGGLPPASGAFSITYQLDGGQNNPLNPTRFDKGKDSTLYSPSKIISFLENGEWSAYEFLGWYTSTDYSQRVYNVNELTESATLYARWGGQTQITYAFEDGAVLFGSYPQTFKDSSVIVGDTQNDRGYYLGSDGYTYVKTRCIYINNGRYSFSRSGTPLIVNDGQTDYYYKIEPIKWSPVISSNGITTLFCQNILDAQAYYDSTYKNLNDLPGSHKGNHFVYYENSTIRHYLNNQFLNTAFSFSQQATIHTAEVDNSAKSTGILNNEFAGQNTYDKIYLPSFEEIKDGGTWGFNTAKRYVKATHFANNNNLWFISSSEYGSDYWTRSPNPWAENDGWNKYISYVEIDTLNGRTHYGQTADTGEDFYFAPGTTHYSYDIPRAGIVPCLQIQFS